MSEVFADAFYYIAISNRTDQFHAVAMQATGRLQQRIVTTRWVLTEVADALSSPAIRRRTHDLLSWIASDSNTTLIGESDRWYERGLALYGSRNDKDWPLTDCISFEVMRTRGITDALTGDHHFEQAGFRALLLLPQG